MKVWIILVRHADRSAWVDSIYENYDQATRRARHIEGACDWLDAEVEPYIVIPERTKPLK